MAQKSDLLDFIWVYVEDKITEDELLTGLANWDYLSMASNSSAFESDAEYVPGSWDDVLFAFYAKWIPRELYGKLCEMLKEDKDGTF